ncbi:MAG TPA: recombination regulator RecX [Enteractinococcus helveticum]|uniref:Regulatory protein RecX n=1 Tax=Enteractinococcus helveticum TaxID=1837282 RepID=A0A921FPY0_9MICC|nr:regulatory protein RecX [Enteractinococcus helveticum]HJF15556.1 recombination regulator RecX [Enteractinococcus helveticum]
MNDQDDLETDQHQAARNIALRQLSAAPKTRHQLAEKLRSREIADNVVEEVLDRFEEVELIDDAAFAESWVRSRHRSKGLARRALSMELRQRGIADDLAAVALEQVSDEDEWTAAYDLVMRKLSRTKVPASTDPESRQQRDRIVRRLVGMLSRKGYVPGVAFNVVTSALDAVDLDPLDE